MYGAPAELNPVIVEDVSPRLPCAHLRLYLAQQAVSNFGRLRNFDSLGVLQFVIDLKKPMNTLKFV